MTSYRYKRRSFLAGIGGAVGLYTLLRNLEASAEEVKSPPRLLLMHWPVGTLRYDFVPKGTGKSYVTSKILEPFETAGLREDLIALFGLKYEAKTVGGGAEAGVLLGSTGVGSPGTRSNGGEGDDSVAGGPSFDQIFLRNVPELASALGFANAIGDARVDSHETSAQCLSYDYATREIESVNPGGMITEHIPLMPDTSPLELYARLFSGFMPGGGDQGAAIRALRLKKSVLDFALRDLDQLRTLAPSSELEKIELHAEAIRKVEIRLSEAIEGGLCEIPTAPDGSIVAKTGSQFVYADAESDTDESPALETLGKLHLGILQAAFQCDLVRVATFQWASAVNQVAFKGLYPTDPDGSYRHHPLSHRLGGITPPVDAPPAQAEMANVCEFLSNAHTWFNQKTAEILAEFKTATDAYGGSLLDHTVVPFFTEVANAIHTRQPLPALILGGRALGLQGGQFQNFEHDLRHFNDLWLTIAQAFFPDADSVLTPLAEEKFVQEGKFTGPIDGLWVKP